MRYRRTTIEGASYFSTLVTHQRRPLFSNPDVVNPSGLAKVLDPTYDCTVSA